ncbi:two component transcriptional regulator [Striga asiatica]|uniref:Two component transcriptional regulator n=1 Tax=Striga asiatica TaxID=4170 RepID=A0A5A7QRW6_STRAF|nr:two component transcriptional regulator [Striga asiatica]
MIKEERASAFLRPREESARAAMAKPPTRQPRKKAEAGRPVRIGPEHCRDHSEMMEDEGGRSQDQLPGGRRQRSAQVEEELLQVHLGSASVKTLMKVCWASKNQAREMRVA